MVLPFTLTEKRSFVAVVVCVHVFSFFFFFFCHDGAGKQGKVDGRSDCRE